MDLWSIPALDQHAHNLVREEVADRHPYPWAFTEAADPVVVGRHARHTLSFRRSLRDLAGLLGCEPTEDGVVSARRRLGLEALARRCFDAARLEAVLLDDGFLPDDVLPLEWHQRLVPVRRVLRVEALAEELLRDSASFEGFEEQFTAALDSPPPGVVAFKSIACYRTGLEVRPVRRIEARARFVTLKAEAGAGPVRLADKGLVDYLLGHTLAAAARQGLPVQLHTGFGDPDLDLRLANPLHLRAVLEDPRYRGAPLVLLHASYPFARAAGYLASVYPQVYLDFGLAVPLLSVAGMRAAVSALLELAPFSKLLYSSDAHRIPELFYLAAKWGRAVLGEVLEESVRDADLSANEA
jgi:predicted TIM-barrel fold metal-dependent hydrolase